MIPPVEVFAWLRPQLAASVPDDVPAVLIDQYGWHLACETPYSDLRTAATKGMLASLFREVGSLTADSLRPFAPDVASLFSAPALAVLPLAAQAPSVPRPAGCTKPPPPSPPPPLPKCPVPKAAARSPPTPPPGVPPVVLPPPPFPPALPSLTLEVLASQVTGLRDNVDQSMQQVASVVANLHTQIANLTTLVGSLAAKASDPSQTVPTATAPVSSVPAPTPAQPSAPGFQPVLADPLASRPFGTHPCPKRTADDVADDQTSDAISDIAPEHKAWRLNEPGDSPDLLPAPPPVLDPAQLLISVETFIPAVSPRSHRQLSQLVTQFLVANHPLAFLSHAAVDGTLRQLVLTAVALPTDRLRGCHAPSLPSPVDPPQLLQADSSPLLALPPANAPVLPIASPPVPPLAKAPPAQCEVFPIPACAASSFSPLPSPPLSAPSGPEVVVFSPSSHPHQELAPRDRHRRQSSVVPPSPGLDDADASPIAEPTPDDAPPLSLPDIVPPAQVPFPDSAGDDYPADAPEDVALEFLADHDLTPDTALQLLQWTRALLRDPTAPSCTCDDIAHAVQLLASGSHPPPFANLCVEDSLDTVLTVLRSAACIAVLGVRSTWRPDLLTGMNTLLTAVRSRLHLPSASVPPESTAAADASLYRG